MVNSDYGWAQTRLIFTLSVSFLLLGFLFAFHLSLSLSLFLPNSLSLSLSLSFFLSISPSLSLSLSLSFSLPHFVPRYFCPTLDLFQSLSLPLSLFHSLIYIYQYFLSLDIIFHSLSSLIIPQLFSVLRANSSKSFSSNMNQLLCYVSLSLDLFLFLSFSFFSIYLSVYASPSHHYQILFRRLQKLFVQSPLFLFIHLRKPQTPNSLRRHRLTQFLDPRNFKPELKTQNIHLVPYCCYCCCCCWFS